MYDVWLDCGSLYNTSEYPGGGFDGGGSARYMDDGLDDLVELDLVECAL